MPVCGVHRNLDMRQYSSVLVDTCDGCKAVRANAFNTPASVIRRAHPGCRLVDDILAFHVNLLRRKIDLRFHRSDCLHRLRDEAESTESRLVVELGTAIYAHRLVTAVEDLERIRNCGRFWERPLQDNLRRRAVVDNLHTPRCACKRP